MPNSDLEGFRRAVQLRDRCRAAAVAAGHRLEVPMSPVQANVAFDAMVDLIRGTEPADVAPPDVTAPPQTGTDPAEQIRQIRRLLIGQRGVGNLATLAAIQSVVWPDDPETGVTRPNGGGDVR